MNKFLFSHGIVSCPFVSTVVEADINSINVRDCLTSAFDFKVRLHVCLTQIKVQREGDDDVNLIVSYEKKLLLNSKKKEIRCDGL